MDNTPYEQQRARASCLAGIVAVSLCAGAIVGRYSAVVFPVSSVGSVSAESKPHPAQQTASQPVGSLAEHLNLKSQDVVAGKDKPDTSGQKANGASKPEDSQKAVQQTTDSPKPNEPARTQSAAVENVPSEPAVEQPEENKVGGATVLNPGANQRTRDTRKAPESVSRNDVSETQPSLSGNASPQNAECARRYASFRESDGTYQPYGSAQRKVCPLLR